MVDEAKELFAGGGEMGALMRSTDWSKTPLGPVDAWPTSLLTSLSICVHSRFPTVIYWGPNVATFYNDGYAPILGAKHPWALGRPIEEVWAEIWDDIKDMIDGVIATGVATWSEDQVLYMQRKGYREECYFTWSFAPIMIESGKIGGLYCAVTETTGRVVGVRRLRTLRELGQTASCTTALDLGCAEACRVLGSNPADVPVALIYLLDRDGEHARLAGAAGIAPGHVSAPKVVRVDDEDAAWPLHRVARSGAALLVPDLAIRLEGPAGPDVVGSALVLPLARAAQSRLYGFLVAGVSPLRELDEDYRAFFQLAGEQVTAAVSNALAYEEERARAAALAEVDRAKTAFFSNVSHEFRTPLTLMLGPTEEALSSESRALSGEALEMVHRNELRLMKLVNALLDFSRIEAGRVEAAFEPSDVAAMTADLASTFRSAIERGGLAFHVDCAPLPEPAYVDREMWEKIVLNLLSNALKFTFEGKIGVSVALRADHVALVVEDTGTGVPPEELPHLFDRFHRVRGARSRTHEGSGIGLALVHELVGLHGGTVEVTSRQGEGTTFTVSIPRGSDHLPRERIGAGRRAQRGGSVAAFVAEALRWTATDDIVGAPVVQAEGEKPRVLVVDDNADLRDYIAGLLRRDHTVVTANDGIDALELARARRPDLVLSDVMMPRLDGFGLLRALREDETTRDVPVILLSARAGEEHTVEGMEAGADDYLAKPFSARELTARVRTHLELARTRHAWAEQLRQRTEDLAAANKELEAFCYSVSHDLRAPLRAISGYAGILLEDYGPRLDDEARRLIGVITDGGVRMTHLIDDLLSFSRLSARSIERADVDMTALVRGVFESLHGEKGEREVEITVQPLPAARVDRAMIEQVWVNLLSNALKYSSKREKSTIHVGVQPDAPAPTYFVKDNGVGFDMKYAGNLFGVFHRLHSATEFEGTGVGLALVDRIVRRHGGRVWAEALVDAGATFYFSLPRVEEVTDGSA